MTKVLAKGLTSGMCLAVGVRRLSAGVLVSTLAVMYCPGRVCRTGMWVVVSRPCVVLAMGLPCSPGTCEGLKDKWGKASKKSQLSTHADFWS